MSGATTALLVASTAVAAYSAYSAGQAQKQSYEAQAQANQYNAKVQENNAIVAGYNAQSASQQASAKEEQQRRQFAILQGQANAGVAQSGTGFGGSNADVLKQNAINNELDALNIRYAGQQENASFLNQATNLKSQAQLSRYQGDVANMNASNANTASYLNAGSSLLSGATQAYMSYKGVGPYKT